MNTNYKNSEKLSAFYTLNSKEGVVMSSRLGSFLKECSHWIT
jgi:hypothetical protein